MATNLNIDMQLLEEAYEIGGMKTKKETVNTALKEFIQRHKQKNILRYFNSVEYDSSYNYKKERNR